MQYFQAHTLPGNIAGYKPGEGLGREKQGIAKPIDARMRPKGMELSWAHTFLKTVQGTSQARGLGVRSRASPSP